MSLEFEKKTSVTLRNLRGQQYMAQSDTVPIIKEKVGGGQSPGGIFSLSSDLGRRLGTVVIFGESIVFGHLRTYLAGRQKRRL